MILGESQSADLGDGFGMFLVAQCYELGQELEKNLAEAIEWYRKSADAGVSGANFQLQRLGAT